MHGQRRHMRGAERHDRLHEVGPPDAQNAGEQAATALADHDRRLTLALDELLETPLETSRGRGGAIDVQANARGVCAVPAAAQP